MRKTIGIIGGMGPAATALLFQKIVENTDANADCEHIHILIDNCPQIADRTQAILSGSDIPAKEICMIGKRLIHNGADLLLIPCNTSHYYYEYFQSELTVPVVNMITETAAYCREQEIKKVGVLATTGTCKTGIFKKALEAQGIEPLFLCSDGQKELMNIIYNQVKAGKIINTDNLRVYLDGLGKKGVDTFILGCTELPMALHNGEYGYRYIDTLDVLAKTAVILAGYPLKGE